MRSVRILLAAVAPIAAGLTGWALGARDDNAQPSADPAAAEAPPAAPSDPAPRTDPAPRRDAAPGGDKPAGDAPGTTQPAPRPRIFGFGSEPVFPQSGGFWQLPAGPGDVILVTDAEHASKVEFLLTPTGTGVGDLAVRIGQDTNGRDGYMVRWHYNERPLLAHLTVRTHRPRRHHGEGRRRPPRRPGGPALSAVPGRSSRQADAVTRGWASEPSTSAHRGMARM